MAKKEKKIILLQVGTDDWSTYQKPNNLEVVHLHPNGISDYLIQTEAVQSAYDAQQKELLQLREQGESLAKDQLLEKPVKPTALLLTDQDYGEEVAELVLSFDCYAVFYQSLSDGSPEALCDVLRQRMAQHCELNQPEELLTRFGRSLFDGQYGAKMPVSDLQVVPEFRGTVQLSGQSHLILEGDYGQDFKQIAYFRYNIGYNSHMGMDLFFEQLHSPEVETRVNVQLMPNGSLEEIVQEWSFEVTSSEEELHIESDISGVLAISLYAKGQGQLKIGPCHYRDSRSEFGTFILGGERFVDDNQQEFMYYFDPQDFKPPLCVYFSGFRSAEGFEGYWMMKGLKTPFMLICDPRLEGGSFYLGSPSFEQKISDVIQEKLDFLGFDHSQLILSGLSMGTFGATYHGAKLAPHAIVIGKPVLSLGEVALKERIMRPGGFPTALDILRRETGRLDDQGGALLDEKFWKQFRQGDFSQTTFLVAYMKHDDYDASAFSKLIEVTRGTGATVVGRGWAGRHGDGGTGPTTWFLKQYQNLLARDFGRGDL